MGTGKEQVNIYSLINPLRVNPIRIYYVAATVLGFVDKTVNKSMSQLSSL